MGLLPRHHGVHVSMLSRLSQLRSSLALWLDPVDGDVVHLLGVIADSVP